MVRTRKPLHRWIPTRASLQSNRWLKWMGPVLNDPRLWRVSRRGIALGVALGIFFGLLVPLAQIPISAAAAVALRANLPVAAAATFVTNPVTFGPVYYGAYRLGKVILGEKPATEAEVLAVLAKVQDQPIQANGFIDHVRRAWQRLKSAGKPLVVGLAVVATVSGLTAYFVISGMWILKTRWTRKRRLRERQ